MYHQMDNFDIDRYLYANEDACQLEYNTQFSNKSRRFSLSIDGSFSTDYDEEISLLTSEMAYAAPDIFDDILLYNPSFNLVEDKLIQGVPKSNLLLSSTSDISFYNIPKNKGGDAYKIWNEAGIPELEIIHRIESSLLDWADKSAELEISDSKIAKIKWKSNSGYEIKSNWITFIKWILCASMCE